MKQRFFAPKYSLVKRIKITFFLVITFTFLCFSYLFYSSSQEIKKTKLLKNNLHARAINDLALEEVNSFHKKYIDNVLPNASFNEKLQHFNNVLEHIDEAIEQIVSIDPENESLSTILKEVKTIITNYKDGNFKTNEIIDFTTNVVIAKIQAIQQQLDLNNQQYLRLILHSKHPPLIITTTLIVLSVLLIASLIWSSSKQVEKAFNTLIDATNRVSNGELGYEAEICCPNELGLITFEFNKMSYKLKSKQDSLKQSNENKNHLLRLSGLFSKALKESEVYEIVFYHLFYEIGIKDGTCSIYFANTEESFLELKVAVGDENGVANDFNRFNLSKNYPICDAYRKGSPIIAQAFNIKDLDPDYKKDYQTTVICLPITIGEKPIGVFNIAFSSSKFITKNEEDYFIALTKQFSDAIHRARLFDKAQKAIKVRDEFLAIASHELQTPLTPLKIKIQSIAKKLSNKNFDELNIEKINGFLNLSVRQIDRISSLIDDLLDVTKIDTENFSLNKDIFNLSSFIEEFKLVYEKYFIKNSGQLTIYNEISTDLNVYWDKNRIEQVMLNLISNALKFAPDYPLELKFSHEKSIITISLKDYGPGIPPEDIYRIFDKYERVATTQNVRGLGLGLYICKQLIEAHKGTIAVESVLKEGATFIIKLPVKASKS